MGKTFNEIFSENLRYYLEEKEKTQADLAKYIGVSTAATNTWCKGSKVPRIEKIDKICTFLNIKRSDLMEDRNKESNTHYLDYTFFIQGPDGTAIPLLLEFQDDKAKQINRVSSYNETLNLCKRIIEAYISSDDITKAMVLRALNLEE